MIEIASHTPRWIREIDRFIHLKSLLFVHGNVLDLASYPVQHDGQTYWVEGNISNFFQRYLMGLGYDVVGTFDPLDGLGFATPEMQKLYHDVLAGRKTMLKSEEAKRSDATNRSNQAILTNPGTRSNGLVDPEPSLVDINKMLTSREVASVFVFNFTSRLLTAPNQLLPKEQAIFTRMLKACLDAREVLRADHPLTNTLILICDKLNDLPPFLYINNPRSRAILVDKPDNNERIRFFKSTYSNFYHPKTSEASTTKRLEAPKELVSQFGVLTDGFSYYEMMSLIGLSLREQIPVQQIQQLCERYKYGVTESAWDKIDQQRLAHASQFIHARIKGQDEAVTRVLEIIKRAKLGIVAGQQQRLHRPRGVLFFAGPTGVGKTEMAKSLAELLFGDSTRLIRFDMSEYAAPNADQRLLGAPPGYVGYEEGGQLTNAIKDNPFSVLLFDEIEKAHPSIFDKFLQILDDGRFTDGRGDTVYFSECIIIFTSNLGTVSHAENAEGRRERLVTPSMAYTQVRTTMLQAIQDHFNYVLGRPEILNRFGDNFVVFDFIRSPLDEQIVDLMLKQLAYSLQEQRKIHLRLTQAVRETLINLARENLEHGGRGIRNVIDAALINPLAAVLFDHDVTAGQTIILKRLIPKQDGLGQHYQLDVKVEAREDSAKAE